MCIRDSFWLERLKESSIAVSPGMRGDQNTVLPKAASKAGVSVKHARSVTERAMPIAGPLLLSLPKLAKIMVPRPRIVVRALAMSATLT